MNSWKKPRVYAVLMLFLFPCIGTLAQGNFRAGASMVDITPPLGLQIVGNFVTPPATHVHDPLTARMLVLDDGQARLAFVIVDNVGVNQEVFTEAGKMIQEETGIPDAQVLMASTHTHSAVSAGGEGPQRRGYNLGKPLDDYQRFLARRIADGVRIAINNLEPARIGWGAGNLPQHLFNRRWRLKNPIKNPFGQMDQVQFNPGLNNPNKVEPVGGTDPELYFLAVQAKDGRPIALLANYSLHYVGGVPAGHISADYFAVFARKIAAELSNSQTHPPFVGILTNGTSGDVNNVDFTKPGKKYEPYEKMEEVAGDVAREVLRVYKNIRFQDQVQLRSARTNLTLQVRKPSKEIYERSKKVVASPEDTKFDHSLERIFAERAISMYEEWPDQLEVPLQVVRIGDLGIRAIPFEVFTETGLELKKKSAFPSNFTISIANGSWGYLATPAQHRLGGYETWLTVSKMEENASEKIVSEILKLEQKVR